MRGLAWSCHCSIYLDLLGACGHEVKIMLRGRIVPCFCCKGPSATQSKCQFVCLCKEIELVHTVPELIIPAQLLGQQKLQ